MENLLVNVIGLRLNSSWWKLSKTERLKILKQLNEIVTKYRKTNGIEKVELYSSVRPDIDLILWSLSLKSKDIIGLKENILKQLSGLAEIHYGFLSIYKKNPNEYNKVIHNNKAKNFFVAYPVKKSADWYLLSDNKRGAIMSEHIKTAMNESKNGSIVSYTTKSFGIGDADFFVIYELESLNDWVDIAEKLRGVEAHKWVIKEEPILVGEKTLFEELLY